MVQEMTEADRKYIVEALARDLIGPIMNEFLRLLPAELERVANSLKSPYRTRAGAAGYLQSGITTIDQLFATGRLKKYFLNSTPLARVVDLDQVIEEDSKKPRRPGPNAKKRPQV